ncbi:sulfite exporter TauE/SafE family protein [Roseivivax sp. GX 12232]|uniref:sulfite exporter TauE/SafE family protein n=1 Tax=Roseivivax sp. GX 12232 TaxID=2900547 RepID=UPI001E292F3E|nr:sulfite exporter TauE/SafE family protein [Roseivivax sp. GX 12232]MCE0504547.1 sulfite exporter TauE/SafE family protein [Roseivivax sp. GX 12232]
MPEALAATLDPAGLAALLALTFAAGAVYGFAGFGAALVFMPPAAALMPLEMAVAAFNVAALASFVTVLPRALPQVDRQGLGVMILCAAASASLGLWVLRVADLTWLRWGVTGVTALTLLALVAGWRRPIPPSPAAHASIGAATGFVGGATGLLGPIMVLFQLASGARVAQSRATALVFLTVTSALLLPLMALQGLLGLEALALGAALLLPYGLGARLGQAWFDPAREGLYRLIAYLVILSAVIAGLPLWDG